MGGARVWQHIPDTKLHYRAKDIKTEELYRSLDNSLPWNQDDYGEFRSVHRIHHQIIKQQYVWKVRGCIVNTKDTAR